MVNEVNQTFKALFQTQGVVTVSDICLNDAIDNDAHDYDAAKCAKQQVRKYRKNTISRQRVSNHACSVSPNEMQNRVSNTSIVLQNRTAEQFQDVSTRKGERLKRVRITLDKKNNKVCRHAKRLTSMRHNLSNMKELKNKSWGECYDSGTVSSRARAWHALSPKLEESALFETPVGGCLNDVSTYQTEVGASGDVSIPIGTELTSHESLKQGRCSLMRTDTTDTIQLPLDTTLDQTSSSATNMSQTTEEARMESRMALEELSTLKHRLERVDDRLGNLLNKSEVDCSDVLLNQVSSITEVVETVDQFSSLFVPSPPYSMGNRFSATDPLSPKYVDCDDEFCLEKHFNPANYAMELLRGSISVESNEAPDEYDALVQYSTNCDEALPPKRQKDCGDVKTHIGALEDDFVLNFIQKAAHEIGEDIGKCMKTITANSRVKTGTQKNFIDAEEVQKLLPYTLSHLRNVILTSSSSSVPITATTNDNTGLYQSGNTDGNPPRSETGGEPKRHQQQIWSEQEAIVKRILQVQPEISREMREEFTRLRRQLDYLTGVQQEHLRRLAREQQAETRRRLLAPRVNPVTRGFLEATYAEENSKKGLDKAIESYELGRQLQRAAQDLGRPIPPLITISTGNSATVSLGPSAPQQSQWCALKEREAQFYERELYHLKDEYNRLLVDEKERHRDERKAFLNALKEQYTTLSRQYKQTVDSLQREARLQQREQQALIERKLLYGQETARRLISLEQQHRYEEMTKKINQDILDVVSSYAASTQPLNHRNVPPEHYPKQRIPNKAVTKRKVPPSDARKVSFTKLDESGVGDSIKPEVQETEVIMDKPCGAEKGLDRTTSSATRRRSIQKGMPFMVQLPDEEEVFQRQEYAKRRANTGKRCIPGKLVAPSGRQQRQRLRSALLSPHRNPSPVLTQRRLAPASSCFGSLLRDSVSQPNPAPHETYLQPKKFFTHQKTLPISSENSLEGGEVASKVEKAEEAPNWAGGRQGEAPQRLIQVLNTDKQQHDQNTRENGPVMAVTAGRSSVGRGVVLFTLKDENDSPTTWLPGQLPSRHEAGLNAPEAEGGFAHRPLPLLSDFSHAIRVRSCVGSPSTGEMGETLVRGYETGKSADNRSYVSAVMPVQNVALGLSAESVTPFRCDYYYFGESTMNDCPRYWSLIEAVECKVQDIREYHSYRQKPKWPRSPLQIVPSRKADNGVDTASTQESSELLPLQITVEQGKDTSYAKEWERSEEEFRKVIVGSERSAASPVGMLKVTSAMAAEAATLLHMRQRLCHIRKLFLYEPSVDSAPFPTLPAWLVSRGGAVTQGSRGVQNSISKESGEPLHANSDKQARRLQEDIMHETIHSVLGKLTERALFAEILQGIESDLFSALLKHEIAQREEHLPLEAESLNPISSVVEDKAVSVELLQSILEDAVLEQLHMNTQGNGLLENTRSTVKKKSIEDDSKGSEQLMLEALQRALLPVDHMDRHKDEQSCHEVVCVPEVPCPLWLNNRRTDSPKNEVGQQRTSDLPMPSTVSGATPVTPSVLSSMKAIPHELGHVCFSGNTQGEIKVSLDTTDTQHLPITNTCTVNVILDLSKVEQYHSSLLHSPSEVRKHLSLSQGDGKLVIMQQEEPRCQMQDEDLCDVIVESVIMSPAVKLREYPMRNMLHDATEPPEDSKVLPSKPVLLVKDICLKNDDHYNSEIVRRDTNLSQERNAVVVSGPISIPTTVPIPAVSIISISEPVKAVPPVTPEVLPSVSCCQVENRLCELHEMEAERRDSLYNQEAMQRDILVTMQEWYSRLHETSKRLISAVPTFVSQSPQQSEYPKPKRQLCKSDSSLVPTTVIRDPVTKFIFEWLKSFNEKQTQHTEGKNFVRQLSAVTGTAECGAQIKRETRRDHTLSTRRKETDTSLYESTSSMSSASSWLTSTNPSSYDPAGGHRFLQANQHLVRVRRTLMPHDKDSVSKSGHLYLRRCRPVLDASSSGSSNQKNTNGRSIDSLNTVTGVTTRYTTTTTRGTTPSILSFCASSEADVHSKDLDLPCFPRSDPLAEESRETQVSSESPPPHRPHSSVFQPFPGCSLPNFPWLVELSQHQDNHHVS
ncbi:unnamed protein product [Phytomonas sp. EM1]|nr:unnamed protein product [Phytomonas sp. EM1]|eukprot:CCW61460.1 unnamed protein product [Phytomonas sp. isolate EM1]